MKVLSDLQQEYTPSHRGEIHHQDHPDEGSSADDLGLDERLRMNVAGHLLRGQEHHFRDLLHPAALPGSYIWGDVMLYECVLAFAPPRAEPADELRSQVETSGAEDWKELGSLSREPSEVVACVALAITSARRKT